MTNIIDIYFDSVGSTATAPSKLWQWSKGQVVRINGLDLPTVYQVHFSNNPTLGTAEPVAVSGNMVSIPDIYLTTGEPVYLFIWLSDETSAETIRKGTIYVAKRSQPSGEYDPTAEQQTIIDGLIGSINTAVDTAEGYANSAQTYSGNAATSATEALNAKDAAQGYVEQASQTAQGVEILVNRAEDAADDAETAKQDVEQLKQAVEGLTDDAEIAKTDAETARGEAQGFAQTASTKASEASQSASQASQSATTATAQAQTATAKATEASQSAETATTKASEASASATTATAKASEASTSASTATTAKNDAVTAKNAAVTAKTGAETARTGAEAAAQSVSASAAQIATNTSDITDLKEDLSDSILILNASTNKMMSLPVSASPTGYKLNPENGLAVKATDYSLIKFVVNAGDVLEVKSDGYMQFQNNATVPSTGSGYRIGKTYKAFNGVVEAPEGATYLIFSRLTNGGISEVSKVYKTVDVLENIFNGIEINESMFEKGGIEQGNNNTYRQACRCRLINKAQYTRDLTITVTGTTTQVGISYYDESGTYTTYVAVSSGSYTIPANSIFRFFVDGKLSQTAVEMTIAEILAGVEFSKVLKGLNELNDDVDDIKNQLDNGNQIPDYYFADDYLPNKARTAQLASGVDGVSFGFITDIHTGDSSRNSMKLAKYIAEKTSALPFMICGGDIPETNTGTLDGLYEQAQYWQEMMSQYGKHNVYSCRGNHDFLANLSSGSVSLTNGSCYSYVMGNRPYNIVPSAKGKLSYYFDVPSAKVRFIVLDEYDVSNTDSDANFTSYVGLSPVQYHWLVDEALKVDGYDVVIVAHQPLNLVDDPSYITNLNLLRDLITAYNAHQQFSGSWGATTINVDFSTYTSNLICVLSGHKHSDGSGDTGFLNIVTTSDAIYDTDGYNRQMGTVTECAFDIISIDTTNKVIKCTRIGAGNDRTFNY